MLLPDDQTAVLDPFAEEPTVIVRADVLEPSTMQGYARDLRSIARRAELYLRSTGIADTAYFGPEPEFYFRLGAMADADGQRQLPDPLCRRCLGEQPRDGRPPTSGKQCTAITMQPCLNAYIRLRCHSALKPSSPRISLQNRLLAAYPAPNTLAIMFCGKRPCWR